MRELSVTVKLWDTVIGYLGYEPGQTEFATFEYDTNFLKTKLEPSPITVPLRDEPYTFDNISTRTFHGLPGFIADALPDKFGNQLIDEYFAKKGMSSDEITALDRLLYIGGRAMGTLSFEPHEQFFENISTSLDIQSLFELSEMVLSDKKEFSRKLEDSEQEQALKLLKIGSSAGGARSKALVAIDKNKKLFDGTIEHPFPCAYFLIKFDSSDNADRDKKDPKGMTRVEYIYSMFARNLDIDIPFTDYLEIGKDFHFLIERFDRIHTGSTDIEKVHYVSWCGITHSDRDTTGAYSYEQLVLTVRKLGLGEDSVKEVFKRAVFNIVGRNHDDHTKNFGFLIAKDGRWSLSPAFDMTYSYDPAGKWTKSHQIKLNGKQDNFSRDDLLAFGKFCNISISGANDIIDKTILLFKEAFGPLADEYGVPEDLKQTVVSNLRLYL